MIFFIPKNNVIFIFAEKKKTVRKLTIRRRKKSVIFLYFSIKKIRFSNFKQSTSNNSGNKNSFSKIGRLQTQMNSAICHFFEIKWRSKSGKNIDKGEN